MRHVDRERVRQAKLAGAASRLRDLATRPDAFDELRPAWPEMAERVEAVAALVDWERSPGAEV